MQVNAGAAVTSIFGHVFVRGPKLARVTNFQHFFTGILSASASGIYMAGGRHALTTSYDGISFACAVALTGKIRIKALV